MSAVCKHLFMVSLISVEYVIVVRVTSVEVNGTKKLDARLISFKPSLRPIVIILLR
jgi:hypothetical protein